MQNHVDVRPAEDPSAVITLRIDRAESDSQFLHAVVRQGADHTSGSKKIPTS
jgi:hypothetical protein